MPLVSVIVTCYNQAHCIESTLRSVIAQSYTNWECIIVDDGSTDSSDKIIESLIKNDNRFNYVKQVNAGVSNARNAGFALANGEYINFLDGDDTFLPKKLEKQLEVFASHPDVYICICDHQHYIASKGTYEHYAFELLEADPLKQIIYKWQDGFAFPLHAVIYRRDLWTNDEYPYPEDYNGRSEDWIFNILVALKRKKYYMLNEVLCTYHHDSSNFTNEIFNSAASAINAAFFIKPQLPKDFQSDFLEHTIKKSMNRYLESKKVDILNSSGNWRLGNFLTKPYFRLIKYFKS